MLATQVSYWQIQETKRHNLATESQARRELIETKRHNLAGEDETRRHNFAWEAENQRHNIAAESENQRHNINAEDIERARLAENKRHNIASEGIDWARVNESVRHNRADESIGRQQNTLAGWRASNEYELGLLAASQRDTELSQRSEELDIKRDQTLNDAIKAKAAAEQAKAAKWRVVTDAVNTAWKNANQSLDTVWRNANNSIGLVLNRQTK